MPLKSQSATEFIVLASFMLLVILGFFAITSSKVLEAKEEGNRKISQDIAEFAYKEIEAAKSVNDGYVRVFSIPKTVNGIDYSINITDDRELIVKYMENEYVRFLPSNVTGNLSRGLNEIRKIKGIVYLSPFKLPPECNDKADNDGDGKIDILDSGCSDQKDEDETDCGDLKCESSESCQLCPADCGVCQTPSSFFIKNGQNNVMYLDDSGNVFLKGKLNQNSNPPTTANDEFVVKGKVGENVAVVNLLTGNMFISGSLQQNQQDLSPKETSNDLILKNSDGEVIAYIDDEGNFYLKGVLTQNENP
ncbi:hypothetical protein HY637_00365 [Candidatus Woesearchaeota archaeon]|nr:hypothetical protein [Candidatus Woesearchaeota archaeon]